MRSRPARRPSRAGLLFFLPLVVAALLAGLAGGLLRAGSGAWLMALSDAPRWVDLAARASAAHAFLMISAFMGSMIGLERAVALKRRAAFLAPAASALAGVLALAGQPQAAAWLALLASGLFVAVNAVLLRRQWADHTVLLALGAVAWAVGCALHALGLAPLAVDAWWLAFLVLTIAAERLEMTRLMRRREGAAAALHACLAALLAGAALMAPWPRAGAPLYGLALVALAAWLITFDIARRTFHAHGLSRYMAVCLLAGYGWLAVSGAAWTGLMWTDWPMLDLALHALALGFVFSMVMGHAPVILPALARVKILYGWPFYLPLALLHGSLALRLAGALFDGGWRRAGSAGNALAIALFAATLAAAALAWHRRHGGPPSGEPLP